jgi:hypothetical protein
MAQKWTVASPFRGLINTSVMEYVIEHLLQSHLGCSVVAILYNIHFKLQPELNTTVFLHLVWGLGMCGAITPLPIRLYGVKLN